MIELTEPQVWTIIGVFSAVFIGMLTIVQTAFIRILRSEIGSVRSEIGSVRSEISSVRSEISALEARMDSKLQALDRDVQALVRREWGDPKP